MKKEYIIVGDNNFWYSSCGTNKKEAIAEAKEIIEEGNDGYACGECGREPCCEPELLYIYKAEEVKRIEKEEEKEEEEK